MVFLRGARQLVTVRGPWPRRGALHGEIGVIHDGSVLINGSRIEEVGSTRRIENLTKARSAAVVDVRGKVILPGLIDGHVELEDPAADLDEFERRIASAPPPPPGLDSDEEPTPRPPSPRLAALALRRWMFAAASAGTTALQLRRDVGIETAEIVRTFRAVASLDGDPLEAGAGVVLDLVETNAADFPSRLDAALTKARSRVRLSGVCALRCPSKAPSEEVCRAVREAVEAAGLIAQVVAAEDAVADSIRTAVRLNARCVAGIGELDDFEADLLADSSTVVQAEPLREGRSGAGTLLPARRLIDLGGAVSLATGFGPRGAPGISMPAAMAIACRRMRMMPEEVITAATINSAAALGLADRLGSIEPGKQADLAVFDVSDYREIPYHLGMNLCSMTIKRGRVIYRAAAPGARAGAKTRGPA